MRNLFWISVFSLALGSGFPAFAQSKKQQKWDEAILALERSDFTVKFSAVRDTIESHMAFVHKNKSSLSEHELAEIKKGYELSAIELEKILQRIKEDFTSPDNRKFIAEHPDRFSSYLEVELNKAFSFYNTQCKEKIDSYIKDAQGSAIGLMEVSIIIAIGKELWTLWNNRQIKNSELSGAYFEKKYVSKYKLKKWEHY